VGRQNKYKGIKMEWEETTGEWTWKQPWLGGFPFVAKYAIIKDRYNYGRYEASWWHGNIGCSIGHYKTKEEAMGECRRHLEGMKDKIEGILLDEKLQMKRLKEELEREKI